MKQFSNIKIIKRLITEHLIPYKNRLILAIFFMIIVAICSATIIKLVQPSIDQIFFYKNRKKLIILPLIILAIHCIKGIAEFFQNYLIKYIGQRILTDLQLRMYNHLLNADLHFIQTHSSGRLLSRFTNDIVLMRSALSNLLVGFAKHLLSIIFLIGIMFRLDPFLSIVVFIVFPMAILPVQVLGRKMRRIFKLSQEELGHYTAKLDETFNSIKLIKSFAAEEQEVIRAGNITGNILKFYKRAAKLDALVSPFMEIFSGLAIGGIIWYGGNLVIDGKSTPGELMVFLVAFTAAYRPFKSLVSLNVNLQEGIAATRRIYEVLDLKPKITNAISAKTISFDKATIKFNNIVLKFDRKIALRDFNLLIKPNKITAIVGGTGSGKTSIANLLVRFYDPTNGEVLINNENIKNIDLNYLRKQISLVTQDTFLFDLTVRENIALGKKNATKEEIINVAMLADAHNFITSLPDGYDTVVGTQGVTLSGGQRQKLSLARAFLKDSNIFIFDEATSSLDQSSESKIFRVLENNICKDKTAIIITHRLSSIVNVNEIIVMKAGKVIEIGSHNDLIARKEEYYKLYTRELAHDNN